MFDDIFFIRVPMIYAVVAFSLSIYLFYFAPIDDDEYMYVVLISVWGLGLSLGILMSCFPRYILSKKMAYPYVLARAYSVLSNEATSSSTKLHNFIKLQRISGEIRLV